MIRVGSTVGNYTVIAKLGEGAMAAVFLAEHPRIGKRVAIKVIHPELASSEEMVSRFFTEARAASQIHHDNVVDVQDFGQTPDGDNFIIMEYLEGDTLAARLRSQTRIEIPRMIRIGGYLCEGLAAAHARGVIHRDLKPDNIFLVRRGSDNEFPKILDFGLAKLTGGPAQAAQQHKTRTGSVLGTPHYMAPEQCEGKSGVDARADIYSLGCILFQAMTGELPFPGEGFGEVLVKHLRERAPSARAKNPQISPALDKVILHCLAKKREYRFQTMLELARALRDPERFSAEIGDDLRRIVGPQPGEADPPPPAQDPLLMETIVGGQLPPGFLPPPPTATPVVSAAAEQRTIMATAQPPQPQQMALSNLETLVPGQAPLLPTGAPGGNARSGRTVMVDGQGAPVPAAGPARHGRTLLVDPQSGPQAGPAGLMHNLPTMAPGMYPPVPLAMQRAPAPGRPFVRSPVFLGLVVGLGLAVIGLVILPLLRGREHAITLLSTPPGAQVLVEGKVLGQTPYVLKRRSGQPDVRVVIHKDGFVDSVRLVQAKGDQTVQVKLVAKPAPPPRQPEEPPPEPEKRVPEAKAEPEKKAVPEKKVEPERRPVPEKKAEPPKSEKSRRPGPGRPPRPAKNTFIPF